MEHDGIAAFAQRHRAELGKRPTALILAEDDVELASTLSHALMCGFGQVVLIAPPEVALPEGFEARVHLIRHETRIEAQAIAAINAMIAAAPEGAWLHYSYNAEYLFYPFCETRPVTALLEFHAEERRAAMLTYVIDLYAADLERTPDAVCRDDAMLDRSGYYALNRAGADGVWKDRQMDFYGGLRWRFEEHVPADRRRIDRIGLFRACEGLRLQPGHTFNIAEYNTFACPWHNNPTAAICSFRTAKALRGNPGSRFDIPSFRWRNSVSFEWSGQQLLDLGLMEPGQWF